MRIGGLFLFLASLIFGLGTEYYVGAPWLEQNALWLMFAGCAAGLAWAVFDFWPRAFGWWHRRTWMNLEDGARHYRDLLVRYGMKEAVEMFDSMASPARPVLNPITSAFRFIVAEGINNGQMEVWGIPENGATAERLDRVDDHAAAFPDAVQSGDEFLMMSGVRYRDLRIRRSSIKSYVYWIGAHDDELKKRAERRKARELREGTRGRS